MSKRVSSRMVGSAHVLGAAFGVGVALLVSTTAVAGVSDALITTKAKAALIATKDVHATAINVDTTDGRVTLNGTVPTESERTKAEAVVKNLSGVTSVDNRLTVGSGASAPAHESAPAHGMYR